MKPYILSLFAAALASASTAIHPRQGDSSCCFGLSADGAIQGEIKEDHIGELSLGGPFQQGGFCYDGSAKTIKDGLTHGCFMRGPTEQFQCYAGLVGATAFDFTSPGKNGKSYLTYDGSQTTFWACPVGSGNDKYYYLYSSKKPDTKGCVSISLVLHNPSAGCASVHNATVVTPTPIVRRGVASHRSTKVRKRQSPVNTATTSIMSGYSRVPDAGLWSSVSPRVSASTGAVLKAGSATVSPTAESSQICSVSPSAPSLAPVKLGSLDNSAPDGIKDSSGEASITSQNSTVFLYNISSSFLSLVSDEKTPLCALQFRMPVCTELPKDYPCYSFSGLEQEFLANSGMNFDLILDDDQAPWNGTMLHQVVPGKNTILGTFECGTPKGSDSTRKMSWHISSVRNFSLEFLHAGVGNDAKFQDGIGAWIVPCQ
ncbi:hypothetical protein EKO27_g4018 [Xylaria grammica]|uniref:Ubiquitin 3 binding protein But2 C-terminal domain-containing protein n=1 Tax=Xylaria grammica TaxID=363999 RepID=A0A439D9I8_9PEZI|nr:hypothetical protein EKO27_g4018 [Xylaria grammica]